MKNRTIKAYSPTVTSANTKRRVQSVACWACHARPRGSSKLNNRTYAPYSPTIASANTINRLESVVRWACYGFPR